ncbi:MAG: hypothetical protein JF571_11725 [Asticcacaulis sp.]|nr:hypothetical protein [Asticcacaulis sp.]
MPKNGKFWLNIDFASARKISPGENCRAEFLTRQNLPHSANSAEWLGKYFHFSEKMLAKKPAKPREILVHGDTGQR